MEQNPPSRVLRFGVFEADLRAGQLRKHGLKVKLQDQPFQILTAFLENAGQVVTREDFRRRLWPEGTFVDFDNSLNAAINKLREALGDSADHPRYVETLPRRGYRFIAPVEAAEPAAALSAAGNGAGEGGKPFRPAPVAEVAAPPWVFRRAVVGHHARRAAVAVLATALFVTGGYLARQRFGSSASAANGKIMLAVLPFENISGDAGQDYFSDGLTEEMISQLGRLQPERLGVIARSSVIHYKHSNKSIDQVARELGVHYALEGSVRRNGDRMRITAQLIQVRDQTHLWAETYERDVRDVLTIQQDVAGHIAQALAAELLPISSAASPSTSSPAAFEAYLQGRFHWSKRTSEGVRKGIAYFQQAVEKDHKYALAYAGLADCYLVWGGRLAGVPAPEAYAKARAAANKALDLDPKLAEAHATLAGIKFEYDWDFQGALAELHRAIELNPSYASAFQWRAEQLAALGRREEAFADIQRALALDPYSRSINLVYGQILMYAGQYEQAIAVFQKQIERDPDFLTAHASLARIYRQQKKYDEWFSEYQKWLTLAQVSQQELAALAEAYHRGGMEAVLRARLKNLQAMNPQPYGANFAMARICASIGDRQQALYWLEKAAAQRDDFVTHITVDPEFDALRSDPAFQQLLSRIGFPNN